MVRRLLIALMLFAAMPVSAQYNIKKMMEEGRRTLDMGYYLVSMELFNRVVSLKPKLYEAWFLMGKSKYHLEDYEGAEQDCTHAVDLNPYIVDIHELRAMCRIRMELFDSAAVDYTAAIELEPDRRDFWFNRAYCYYRGGHRDIALQQLDYIVSRWHGFAEALTLQREVQSGRQPSSRQNRWIEGSSTLFSTGKDKWTLKKQDDRKFPSLKIK